MFRFLLDANISHKTAEFLNSLGRDVKTVAQFGLEELEDMKISEKAVQEKRIDFGETKSKDLDYCFKTQGLRRIEIKRKFLK